MLPPATIPDKKIVKRAQAGETSNDVVNLPEQMDYSHSIQL